VEVTNQRTMQDYARVVRWLVDEIYPQAEYIRLVQVVNALPCEQLLPSNMSSCPQC
jgi:hypothetical protein